MQRSLIIWILFLLFCYGMKAQVYTGSGERTRSTILPEEYLYLAGSDLDMRHYAGGMKYVLADESYILLYTYDTGDSVLFVRTQCAPECSSFARVYVGDWKLLRTIATPDTMIFPEAYIWEGQLHWRDNYKQDESPE